MNSRERFIKTCNFDKNIVPPYWETLGFWDETRKRWYEEGVPKDKTIEEYFEMTPR